MNTVPVRVVIVVALLGSAGCVVDQGEPRSGHLSAAVTVEEEIDIQTAHPYANHEDQSWTIRAPEGATRISFTFDTFETERGFDYLDIRDVEGEVVHRLSGRHNDETYSVDGNVVQLHFRSDYSITRYGFAISSFTYEIERTRPTDHRPYCGAIGSRSEGWYWGDTGELIRFELCADLPEPECGAIGSRSEGWYVPDGDLIVWDNCRARVRIAIEGENCGPSIGFSCYDGLYCQGVPVGVIGGSGVCREHGYCETAEDCDAEGNLWLRPMCMGTTTCFTESNQCGVICDTEPQGPWSWTTYLLRDVESEHPYTNNFSDTWDVHHEGASMIRLHFDEIRIERGFDRLTVSGNLDERPLVFDGYHNGLWTEEVEGNTATIALETDYSITYWGFRADMVSVYEQLDVGMCNIDQDCVHGEVCHQSLCFSAYAPCYGTCMRDNHCDDGTMITCRRMIPNCPEGTILAYQMNCYVCVDPETCEEPGSGGGAEGDFCSSDADCNDGLRCKDRASSDDSGTCQDELWCSPATVEADCSMVVHPAIPGVWACVEARCSWQPGMTYGHFEAAGLPIAIPDNDTAGVESRIEIAGMAPTGCSVTTSLTIDHTWRGDLRVTLMRPDGSEVVLHDRSGSSADDLIIVDEDVSAAGTAQGEWILHVSDNAQADEGTLESWSLTVDCS